MTGQFDLGAMLSAPVLNNKNITEIEINKLVEFTFSDGTPQPFKTDDMDSINELAEDIKRNGILSPAIVRPLEDGKYQLLSGHRRTMASKIAGINTMPCLIKSCDDKTAQLILVNANLMQRQNLLPSEKAKAYKIQLECSSSMEIADKAKINRRTIFRYIKLTSLAPELLDKVDEGKITFVAAIELADLYQQHQRIIYDYCNDNKVKLNKKLIDICQEVYKQTGMLSEDTLDKIVKEMDSHKPKEKFVTLNFPACIKEIFPDSRPDEIVAEIMYRLNNNRRNEE